MRQGGSGGLINWPWKFDRGLLAILGGALVIRAVAAIVLHLLSVAQGGDGFWGFAIDAYRYEQDGLRQAAGWRESGLGAVEGVGYSSWYVPFLGGTYWAFGGAGRAVAVGVNVVAGVAAVALAWLLARRLAGRTAALLAAGAMALLPTHVLWSTQVLKDPLTVVVALAALVAGLALAGGASRWSALAAPALMTLVVLLTGLRWYTAIAVAGVLLTHALAHLARTRQVLPLIVAAVVAALAPWIAGEGVGWTRYLSNVTSAEGRRDLEGVRDALYRHGGAAVESPPCLDLSLPGQVAACLPGALAFGLFEPLPARWFISEGGIERLVALQLGPWYVLVLLAVAGTVWAVRAGRVGFEALALALFVVGYATALGVVVANYGALVRLRAPFEPVVVVLAAVAVAAWVERRRAGRSP